jgi:hypothetical protein
MRFRYLKDPLFLFCCGIYFVNRLLFKPLFGAGFFHNHLNDLICIPFWVPIMLVGLRRLGLRTHDGRPSASEVMIPLITWSVAFEIFLPTWGPFKGIAFADHRDVLYYAVGALIASLFWLKYYFRPQFDYTQTTKDQRMNRSALTYAKGR